MKIRKAQLKRIIKEELLKMSQDNRWGKPRKNIKRRDPRYFLNEAWDAENPFQGKEAPRASIESWQDLIEPAAILVQKMGPEGQHKADFFGDLAEYLGTTESDIGIYYSHFLDALVPKNPNLASNNAPALAKKGLALKGNNIVPV